MQEGPIRQPARTAPEKRDGAAGRRARRQGGRDHRRREREITKREAVVTQLVNKSTSADLRATKMLIDMLNEVEQKAGTSATRAEDVSARPLLERKEWLAALLSSVSSPLHHSDHQIGRGRDFHATACAASLEGIVSKRADASYASANRGLWLKVKCLHREEFVVVGWTA